jgi:5,10-methylenetetrahydromethanopterin reductase
MTFRLGVGLLQEHPPARLIEMVRTIEGLGYDDLWYANEKFYRDPWVGLTLAALHSQRLRIGTFIADPYTQHPALIAVAIATLAELAPGRVALIMGAGGAGTQPLGFGRRKPAVAIREAVQIIRQLLRGDYVDFEGDVISFRGGRLSFESRYDIPIFVASRGNLTLKVGGEVADGVMIATYATLQGLQHGLHRVQLGAEAAGRGLHDVEILTRVDVCIHPDRRIALDAVRPMVARMMGSSYPDKSFVEQMGLEIPPELEEVLIKKDHRLTTQAAHLVPDRIVEAYTWAGSAEEVAQRVAEVVEMGITSITFLAHPADDTGDVMPTIRAFAEEVRPRVDAMLSL